MVQQAVADDDRKVYLFKALQGWEILFLLSFVQEVLRRMMGQASTKGVPVSKILFWVCTKHKASLRQASKILQQTCSFCNCAYKTDSSFFSLINLSNDFPPPNRLHASPMTFVHNQRVPFHLQRSERVSSEDVGHDARASNRFTLDRDENAETATS
eukprot:672316-Hanusia_phi.AAC.2